MVVLKKLPMKRPQRNGFIGNDCSLRARVSSQNCINLVACVAATWPFRGARASDLAANGEIRIAIAPRRILIFARDCRQTGIYPRYQFLPKKLKETWALTFNAIISEVVRVILQATVGSQLPWKLWPNYNPRRLRKRSQKLNH